ncbi:TRAP transporter small permease [Salipiger aestuarii]|uniref:TRAP transporter small permease protein n=1 Tax=Salipiger aestuarii TaxID=568098 RepID=A0A327YCJ2_9RHOB|nr:TRAP transporter small permease [Salipiger aestuarii]EIE52651.1 TRAP transporter, DctQ subunit [Citreicella sp. 357]KAA8610871.1 C4-dicarboxylate ABC transporter substrate-binding protein [Salipiger aestuarii]KAB2542473.1 C4-dicarboxylate ABC transporter substrate-binding protein [Salipiger aestuarii]RAK18810.1 C4-dicarboxylate transporter DctQ subunit [Salipiger aestuarii]
MSSHSQSQSALGRMVNEIEETAIAVILGIMTLITFVNVVLRYGFNTGLIWGLEAVTILFAWLVLFGISYAVKTTAHLGVDALTNLVPLTVRRALAIIAAVLCIVYAALLMKGAWDYWANFANLPQTTGRWFPTGFEEMSRTSYRSWYEVVDIPMPDWLRFIEPMINEGEPYEKLPRFIPYVMLPFGALLLLVRFVQAGVRVWTGAQDSLIVSHEAEDAVQDVAHMNRED